MKENPFTNEELMAIFRSTIEAGIRDRSLAKEALDDLAKAIRKIEATSRELPPIVSEKVGTQIEKATNNAAQTLLEKFNSANASAERAQNAYEKAHRNLFKWAVLPALCVTALCSVILVGTAAYMTPSIEEIKNKRKEYANLIDGISYVEKLNKVELTKCSTGKETYVICAKFDPQDRRNWQGYKALAERK